MQLQLLPPPPPPPPHPYPKGTVLHSQNCMFNHIFTVQCPAGYKVDSGVCKKCPEGQYQGKINATTCVNCPQYMTTRVIGSTSQSQCFCMYSDVLVFLVLFAWTDVLRDIIGVGFHLAQVFELSVFNDQRRNLEMY